MDPAETYRYADFTEAKYAEIVRSAAAAYAFEPFGTRLEGKHVLWRHDVDFSIHRAQKLARIEAAEGVRATYFVRLRGPFYSPLEAPVEALIREIVGLGHWIGLHFDMATYPELDGASLEDALTRERRLLAEIADADVLSFSFHNPSHSGGESVQDETLAGMINAYAPSIRERYAYVSDSNGYWRERRLSDVVAAAAEQRLHVLTHPEWWQEVPMSPRERMLRCIDGRAQYAIEAYERPVREDGRPLV